MATAHQQSQTRSAGIPLPCTRRDPCSPPTDAEWIANFKDKFDSGWDAYREEVFKRQKELGIIPKYAKLTLWPDESQSSIYPGVTLKHWNQLNYRLRSKGTVKYDR